MKLNNIFFTLALLLGLAEASAIEVTITNRTGSNVIIKQTGIPNHEHGVKEEPQIFAHTPLNHNEIITVRDFDAENSRLSVQLPDFENQTTIINGPWQSPMDITLSIVTSRREGYEITSLKLASPRINNTAFIVLKTKRT